MEIVVQPLPGLDLGNAQTGGAVGKWCEEEETSDQRGNNNARGGPGSKQGLASNALPNRPATGSLSNSLVAILGEACNISGLEVEDEFNQGSCDKRAREVSW